MLTVALGLASSLCYALGDFVMVKVVRRTAVPTALTWVMTAGLVILLPLALLTEGVPHGSDEWTAVVYAVVSGLCELGGLACVFRGLVTGNLSVVAPLASLGGGIAAGVTVMLGESLPPAAIVGLAVAIVGCLMAALQRADAKDGPSHPRTHVTAGAGWALLAALLFAAGMLLFARAPALTPIALAAYGRLGAVVVLVPLALFTTGLRLPRSLAGRAWRAGVIEACALVCIATALRLGPVAVATVFGSQIGTMAALLGLLLLRERPSRTNLGGVVLTCVAATLIAYGA